MQIGGLQLQHFIDTRPVDFVRCITNFLGRIIRAAKACLNELLAIFVKQIERVQVRAHGDFDELGKAVPDLCCRQRAKKCEIKEGVHRSVVSTQSILVVAMVHSNLDRD